MNRQQRRHDYENMHHCPIPFIRSGYANQVFLYQCPNCLSVCAPTQANCYDDGCNERLIWREVYETLMDLDGCYLKLEDEK